MGRLLAGCVRGCCYKGCCSSCPRHSLISTLLTGTASLAHPNPRFGPPFALQAELSAWAPGLVTVAYRGSAAEREEVFASQLRRGRGFHVALTTYELLMGKHDR